MRPQPRSRSIRPSIWKKGRNTILTLLRPGSRIVAVWPTVGPVRNNWGDKLNPYVISALSGKPVLSATDVFARLMPDLILCIGSGLGRVLRRNVVVYGSGFVWDERNMGGELPPRILAVRGPLSAARVRAVRGDVELAIGDPALLMPLLYRPKVGRRYAVGYIPHFREQELPQWADLESADSTVIDITGGIEDVCDAVAACDRIVSSSLHGVILAHSLGIPAIAVAVSDLLLGDGFKFDDYLASVGLGKAGRRPCATRADIIAAAAGAAAPVALPSIERLLRACPFGDPQIIRRLIADIPRAYSWRAAAVPGI